METPVSGCPPGLSGRGLAPAALIGFKPDARAASPRAAVPGASVPGSTAELLGDPRCTAPHAPASFVAPLLEAALEVPPTPDTRRALGRASSGPPKRGARRRKRSHREV